MQPPKSISLIEDYLAARGYRLHHLTLGSSPYSTFVMVEAPSGRSMILSRSKLTYPFAMNAAREVINDKTRTHDFARYLDVPVPDTIYVPSQGYEVSFVHSFLKKHKKLVVKPHNSFQSRGLTIDITTEEQLYNAIAHASSVSATTILQEQVYGEEVRFVTIDGVVRAALLRQKPQVIGDDTTTIADLIKEENRLRRTITTSMVPYPVLDEQLVDPSLLKSSRIPSVGESIELNKSTMIRGGASVYDILPSIDSSYVTIAERAVKSLGKGFIGVDLMIHDYKSQASSTNYKLIELNASISLPMCYSCRDGKHFDVLEKYIGPMLEKTIN